MLRFAIFFLIIPNVVSSQVIATFGGGGASEGDGGEATAAIINNPCQINFDNAGNLYIASGVDHRVRKIDTSRMISTIVGNGSSGYAGDGGQATAALINFPGGVVADSIGNLFIADGQYGAIRRVDRVTGVITTICGNDTAGYSGDGGPASAARLYGPEGMCFDKAGNLYIADCDNNVVRKINTMGTISTFAGTGEYGYNGDEIPATAAKLYLPSDVEADEAGNIFISDWQNFRIRKVNRDGVISTYAGNGMMTYIGDGMVATSAQFEPGCIKFDKSENLFVCDAGHNHRVYMVDRGTSTFYSIAGDGIQLNAGDGGPATAASFAGYLFGLAFDVCGNLYIGNITAAGDSDKVRMITYNSICDFSNVSTPLLSRNSDFFLYPNPAITQLSISSGVQISQIIVSSLTGQTVYQQQCNTQKAEINIASLTSGLYLIAIIDEEGNKTIKKVIKQ